MKVKMKVILFLVMIILSVIYGLINHLIIMPIFENQLTHCLILSLAFGVINFYVTLYFIKRTKGLEKSKNKLESIIYIDKLTGLLNRRSFDRDILELTQFEEYSIIFIDIDDFKKVNDSYGHAVGDQILSRVSKVIRGAIKTEDMVYRYGGEEIVIVLKNCNQVNANSIAEKVRIIVKEIEYIEAIPITISLGIATYPDNGKTIKAIINNADNALLRAKKTGKDRSIVFDYLKSVN